MPKFEHDCERCEFLASISFPKLEAARAGARRWSDPTEFDLYHCATGSPGGTLIARTGNEGSEYHSERPSDLSRREPPTAANLALKLAQVLAVDLHLIWQTTGFADSRPGPTTPVHGRMQRTENTL